jgi:hypothetical protein
MKEFNLTFSMKVKDYLVHDTLNLEKNKQLPIIWHSLHWGPSEAQDKSRFTTINWEKFGTLLISEQNMQNQLDYQFYMLN